MSIREYYIRRMRKNSKNFSNSELEAVFAGWDEQEIYNMFKNTTHWRLLVLKVRLFELVATLPLPMRKILSFGYWLVFGRIVHYPVELIMMVNTWEN